LTDASISDKHTASIFRAEMAMLGTGGNGPIRTRDRGKRFQASRKYPSKHQRGRGMGRE
jgi:hypothetical protein